MLRATRGLPPTQELAVYEEVEFETSVRFEMLSETKTLKESELQSGDIIVFQTLPLPEPAAAPAVDVVATTAAPDGEDHEPLLKIPAFFERVKNRVVVNIHKLPPQQHNGQGVRD